MTSPTESPSTEPALAWRDVRITYTTSRGDDTEVVAVDGVDLAVEPGGTVGIAGESGCGKSTLAMSALRLLPRNATLDRAPSSSTARTSTAMRWGRLRAVRWTQGAIVFQGAMHSLNPVRTVGRQIAEAIELHGTRPPRSATARAARIAAAGAWSTSRPRSRRPTRTSCPAARSSGS